MKSAFVMLLCWTLTGSLVGSGVDGDTFDAHVAAQVEARGTFLGDVIVATTVVERDIRIRLLGINTPERGQPKWAEATAYTTAWAQAGPFQIETCKTDSFGRWLSDVTRQGESLNEQLLSRGLAVPFKR